MASEVGGNEFTNGAITGAYIMLFNDLMHSNGDDLLPLKRPEPKNNGIVALGFSISLEVGFGFSVSVEIATGVLIIDGPDTGSLVILSAGALGLGSPDVSGDASFLAIEYCGDLKNFTRHSLGGKSFGVGASILTLSGGYSKSAPDIHGGYTISYKAGANVSLTPSAISARESNSKLWNIFKK